MKSTDRIDLSLPITSDKVTICGREYTSKKLTDVAHFHGILKQELLALPEEKINDLIMESLKNRAFSSIATRTGLDEHKSEIKPSSYVPEEKVEISREAIRLSEKEIEELSHDIAIQEESAVEQIKYDNEQKAKVEVAIEGMKQKVHAQYMAEQEPTINMRNVDFEDSIGRTYGHLKAYCNVMPRGHAVSQDSTQIDFAFDKPVNIRIITEVGKDLHKIESGELEVRVKPQTSEIETQVEPIDFDKLHMKEIIETPLDTANVKKKPRLSL